MSDPDSITAGSADVPDVLRTLAAVLPQFQGDDLEAQLQTYDAFLGFLAPAVRPRIADLLREAARHAPTAAGRERIEAAAANVAAGGRAAEPYDHAKAMQAYTEEFRKTNPIPVVPQVEKPAPHHSEHAPGPVAVAVPAPNVPAPDTTPGTKRTHPLLLAQLDQIESELKRINRWADHPPDLIAAYDRGELKTFLDAPSFELWLQAVFLIRARRACLQDQLPDTSGVGEMARRQYDYMSIDHDAEPLLRLLQHFDELVELAAQGRA